MTGDIADAGDIATGAIIARAVEPEAGETTDGSVGDCLNCQSAVSGAYCSKCGQKARVHRTLKGFGHDILHGVLHFDGKIWRTLPMLLLNPGNLTRRYIHGERARFVSPMALFLFCVFLTFAIFSRFAPTDFDLENGARGPQNAQELAAAKAVIQSKITDLRDKRRIAAAKNEETGGIDSEIERNQDSFDEVQITKGSNSNGIGTNLNPGFESESLNEAIRKAGANPQLLFYKVQSNAYKFSWALIPISIPFIWLLFFWRRDFKMFDHAVFVTYSLCFMMILSCTFLFLEWVPALETPVILMMVFIPPLHIYRQMKQAYGTSRAGALWRTAATLWFALLAFCIFAMLIVMLGLVG
jgi:hypothetical protein